MQAKRWISGLVACAMLATMLPVQAFATDIDSEPASPATWERSYNADELYALVKDDLDSSASIDLAAMAELDTIARNTSDDGRLGQLTQVRFDDDTVILSTLNGETSYTLTFADDEPSTEEGTLPQDPETNPPAAETETGTVVDQPGAAEPENDPAVTPDPTGPPAGTEGAEAPAEGAEAPAEGAEAPAENTEAPAEGAEVPAESDKTLTVTETGENGQVLGAMLTVNETEVSKVTLVYTANVQNTSDEIMP